MQFSVDNSDGRDDEIRKYRFGKKIERASSLWWPKPIPQKSDAAQELSDFLGLQSFLEKGALYAEHEHHLHSAPVYERVDSQQWIANEDTRPVRREEDHRKLSFYQSISTPEREKYLNKGHFGGAISETSISETSNEGRQKNKLKEPNYRPSCIAIKPEDKDVMKAILGKEGLETIARI